MFPLQLQICFISPCNQIIKRNNQIIKTNNQIFKTTFMWIRPRLADINVLSVQCFLCNVFKGGGFRIIQLPQQFTTHSVVIFTVIFDWLIDAHSVQFSSVQFISSQFGHTIIRKSKVQK